MFFLPLTTFLPQIESYSGQVLQPKESYYSGNSLSQNSSKKMDVFPPLLNPEDIALKKLKDYKEIITLENPDYIMVFSRIPSTRSEAREFAEEISSIIKEYDTHGFIPIIIFEPGDADGASLGRILRGIYDKNIHLFFSELKEKYGISERQLGLVVPYPEANTPAFDRSDFTAHDFHTLVNNFFLIARKYYPTLRGSVLLDAKSYNKSVWEGGQYVSLKPYIEGIDPSFIISFGLQGFPWISEDGKNKLSNMRNILPYNLIDESAKLLETKNIWLNTGTIGRAYTVNTRISPVERTKVFNSLLLYLRMLKLKGYTTMAHIFSENNLDASEKIDWSYTQSKSDLTAYGEFIRKAHSSSLKVGFYDQ